MQLTNVLTTLSTCTFFGGALAQNMFYYPTASAGQSFRQGETINVSWQTNYTQPYLDLFCSYINNPIQQFKIPSDTTVFKLTLDYAPQPNCLLQVQDGPGPVAQRPSFGTGVFAIAAIDGSSNSSIPGSSPGNTPDCVVPAQQRCNCASGGAGASASAGLPSQSGSVGSMRRFV